ncbi:MAG TPA: NAD(P)H-binding protein [Balneolales bacterium]|jgi:uncharacterized protein YbjT (DUF2867 family)|nr:NAD(P)H-binding protein [Balneolales bacterium]
MNIVVTGSLGNVSQPLAEKLVRKGHNVTVISSNPRRQNAIENLGATAAIGKMEDADFLASSFTGADVVYCMIPLNLSVGEPHAYLRNIAQNYVKAIKRSGIKRMILLSGWVAGVLDTYKELENMFNDLRDVSVTHIRPGYFYSNFYDSIGMIKGQGLMGALMALRYMGLGVLLTGKRGMLLGNFGGDDPLILSAPSDIADAIVDEMTHPRQGKNVRYVASDKMTCNEAATILGTAIGKPYLKWVRLTDKAMQQGLQQFGLSPKVAATIVEMQAPVHKGLMAMEFAKHDPFVGKVKMGDFVKEFAAIYNNH